MSAPRGFAVVGASQTGIPWTEWLVGNLVRHGYPGEIWLVNPRRETLLGRPCYPDIDDLPAVPEVAALLTNAGLVLREAERLIAAGCRRLLVVSNGFGELGTDEGRARERRLRELCAAEDVLLVGPNCVGFALMHEDLCAISEPIVHGLTAGDVSVVSQSGGLTAAALRAVHTEGLGIDFAASLGNGAVLDVAAALEFALARPTTRVVLGVVESLADRDRVERVAVAARAAGKTVALLLLGASEGARGVAASHTGAVVNEQRTVGAWLRSIGIVTVATVEELARVASLAGVVGATGAAGGYVATLSGGGAGLAADLAVRHGVPLAAPSPETAESLRAALPAGSYIGNPLDINTGDAAAVYTALGEDPGVTFLIEPWQLPWPTESPEYHWQRAAMERLRDMSRTTGLPVLIASVAHQPVSEWMSEFAEGTGLWVSPSLELTLAALGRLALPARSDGDLPAASAPRGTGAAVDFVAEAAARDLLAASGLPVVGGAEAADEDAAAALAATLTGPFAVKLSLDTVAHKERVGGVLLGVAVGDVRAACATIRANAVAAGVSDGSDVRFLVTEMVSGPEILVGVVRDALAGPSATVAIGGWAAEAGAVFGTIPLPAEPARVQERIEAWNLPHLVGAERSASLAAFLVDLGRAVTGPLAEFREVEINPVMLTRRGALVVDALLIR